MGSVNGRVGLLVCMVQAFYYPTFVRKWLFYLYYSFSTIKVMLIKLSASKFL